MYSEYIYFYITFPSLSSDIFLFFLYALLYYKYLYACTFYIVCLFYKIRQLFKMLSVIQYVLHSFCCSSRVLRCTDSTYLFHFEISKRQYHNVSSLAASVTYKRVSLWWIRVPDYHPSVEHFSVSPPMYVHCKKYLQLHLWIPAVSRKKLNILSQIQLVRVAWSKKPDFSMLVITLLLCTVKNNKR
jgi:hypothetical protein